MKKDFKKIHNLVNGCKLLKPVYSIFTGKRWRQKLKAATTIAKGDGKK